MNTIERRLMTNNKPQFNTWTHINLFKFAEEAYDKLSYQNEQIQYLQCDLKAALAAYRELNTTDTKQD